MTAPISWRDLLPFTWLWSDKGSGVAVMLHAFVDDSGSFNENEFICLAGYVTDTAGWDSLEHDWKSLLAQHGLRRIHTTDFLAAKKEYAETWSATSRERRTEILKEFILVARKHVRFGLCVGVDARAYRKTADKLRKSGRKIENVKVFCVERVLNCLISQARGEWGEERHVVISFDDSPQSVSFHSALYDLLPNHKELADSIVSVGFANDFFSAPLQAADVLACLTAQQMRAGSNDWEHNEFRDALFAEHAAIATPYASEYWDEEELRKQLLPG